MTSTHTVAIRYSMLPADGYHGSPSKAVDNWIQTSLEHCEALLRKIEQADEKMLNSPAGQLLERRMSLLRKLKVMKTMLRVRKPLRRATIQPWLEKLAYLADQLLSARRDDPLLEVVVVELLSTQLDLIELQGDSNGR